MSGPDHDDASEPRPWEQPGAVRRDLPPHRGPALTGKEAEGGGWRRLDDAAWRQRLGELVGPQHAAFLKDAEPLRPLPVLPEPE
jgi:hypothetical protein